MPAGPLAIPALPDPLSSSTRTWIVPGSKSITNRAYVLAALSDKTVLHNVLESDDTLRMRECLTALGVEIRDRHRNEVEIWGGRKRLHAPTGDLFVGNSGTTVRFLAGLAALIPGTITFRGDQHMAKRPILDLVEGLRQLGVQVDCPTGCPPLTIHGGSISGTHVTMRGEKSSQYFTALLLSAGAFDVNLQITVEGELVSRPYIEMTIEMVHRFCFNAPIRSTPNGFLIEGKQDYGYSDNRILSYYIEPDASSASYPFALAAVTGRTIDVPGLGAHSLQGDFKFTEILQRMGAVLHARSGFDVLAGRIEYTSIGGPPLGERLRGIEVDMHHISDTVMTLAAIAPLCDGPTTIRNVANIRIKETDRLIATVNELRRVGQQVEHGDDWLKITPRPLKPATIECYSDHRMAMSFAVLAASARDHHWDSSVPASDRQIRIADPACTAKTYPGFWDDLAKLYPPTQKPW